LSANYMQENITLPAVKWLSPPYSVGYAEQLLIPEQSVKVEKVESKKIGPRTTEDCLVLSSGEQIIVTKRAGNLIARKNIVIPAEVTGILRERSDGKLEWIFHRKQEQVRELISEKGLVAYISEGPKVWPQLFRYNAASLERQGLRPPQLGALFAVGAHWTLHKHSATIVMPTGTGKTETMLSVLAAHGSASMIVAVPSKALRKQTAEKFLTFGLLQKLELLPLNVPYPVVGVLTRQPKTKADLRIFSECNVVVSVIASLTGGDNKTLASKIADISDLLVVDEAHHIAARTWGEFKEAFSAKRVLQFTATPFRSDGKLVDGDVIFNYPLRKAQQDGYFKPISFIPVYELTQKAADEAIAKEACKRLKFDLEAGYDHLMMVRCDSIARAEEVLKLYLQHGKEFYPQIIHSELKDSEERVDRLIKGSSKIAVCVNMLGEGFDLPSLKIAALHDPQKSLGPLLQFAGRFTRTSGKNLGDATVVANIADPNVSIALERLYSEDSDWNSLLSEFSSQAAKEHADLIDFLNGSVPLSDTTDGAASVSHHLLRPTLSTLTYTCKTFSPKKFHEAIVDKAGVIQVWLNDKKNTLFFVTRTRARVKWTRSKEVVDTEWHLFVLHHDPDRELLYLASSDKSSNHEELAKAVGAQAQITGEQIFRSLGRIGRLVFNNLGVTKHGRRNLSYAMYTGADVRQALSISEKSGSRKANLNGMGWEKGKQISIGCSYKGRVWSKETGTIPRFIEWAMEVGDKLTDTSIKTADILDSVLIPDEVTVLPDKEILCLEWPVEILRQSEDRVELQINQKKRPIYLCDIQLDSIDSPSSTVHFSVLDTEDNLLASYSLIIGGEKGFSIVDRTAADVTLLAGSLRVPLVDFFSSYPPLIRFVDLTELDGNLLLSPQNPYDLSIPDGCFQSWDWTGTDIRKESIWKKNTVRKDSVQWAIAQKYAQDNFEIIYDDDGAGEAADLICMIEEKDVIRVALVHCKFSDGEKPGARVEDAVAVCSQAVRSAKWAGKFKELCRHLLNRNESRKTLGREIFLKGDPSLINRLSKASRFKEVKPEILLVQPGISIASLSKDQRIVIAAAATYLKETIGIDITIICSE